jgi:hypothetical protein
MPLCPAHDDPCHSRQGYTANTAQKGSFHAACQAIAAAQPRWRGCYITQSGRFAARALSHNMMCLPRSLVTR